MSRGVEYNDRAIRMISDPLQNPALARVLATLAVRVQVSMKAKCPVSRVYPVYATRGATVPGGRRLAGDFPLPPSGRLRKSITRNMDSDGSWIIGPTVDYGVYVSEGTRPHIIRSHGPWPLRSRVTGQVFGRVVNHPGTRPTFFIERAVSDLPSETFHLDG